MGMGLEIYNASGQKTFASSDYLPRYLGSVFTGQSNGSVTNAGLTDGTGTPFYLYFPLSTNGSNVYPPQITISGNVVSWSFDYWTGFPDNSYFANGILIYGLR